MAEKKVAQSRETWAFRHPARATWARTMVSRVGPNRHMAFCLQTAGSGWGSIWGGDATVCRASVLPGGDARRSQGSYGGGDGARMARWDLVETASVGLERRVEGVGSCCVEATAAACVCSTCPS